MTELERFTMALLKQWHAGGGADGGPIAVGALLDRVLPYRVARRTLGIDVSEDYEAMVLRLLAEDEDLVRVEPVEAADMAKATISSRLPDLDALQLLRSATLTITERTIARLGETTRGATPEVAEIESPQPSTANDVIPLHPGAKLEAPATVEATASADHDQSSRPKPKSKRRGPSVEETPASPATDSEERDSNVIPLHDPSSRATVTRSVAGVEGPPPDFLTTVHFTPPVSAKCWSCSEALPVDRPAKFCPFCGADQQRRACAKCGAPVERGWKHCAECGAKL